jgi:hypothetical protein
MSAIVGQAGQHQREKEKAEQSLERAKFRYEILLVFHSDVSMGTAKRPFCTRGFDLVCTGPKASRKEKMM